MKDLFKDSIQENRLVVLGAKEDKYRNKYLGICNVCGYDNYTRTEAKINCRYCGQKLLFPLKNGRRGQYGNRKGRATR